MAIQLIQKEMYEVIILNHIIKEFLKYDAIYLLGFIIQNSEIRKIQANEILVLDYQLEPM